MKNVKKELLQGRVSRPGSSQATLESKFKGLLLTNPAVEKANSLLLEFVDASELMQGPPPLNLSKTQSQFATSQIAFSKYKRLVLVVTQD